MWLLVGSEFQGSSQTVRPGNGCVARVFDQWASRLAGPLVLGSAHARPVLGRDRRLSPQQRRGRRLSQVQDRRRPET